MNIQKNNPNDHKFKNFQSAFLKLKTFLKDPITSEREQAGVIQAFEFTFEQCWKCFQKISQDEGISVGSPKQAIKSALKLGKIKIEDESAWLKMIEDRNLTSHTYHEEIALEIFNRVQSQYLPLFEKALNVLFAESK